MKGLFRRIGPKDNPYMTEVKLLPTTRFGELRLHIIHRPDIDRSCHDHPADFYTFPLVSYTEVVLDLDTMQERENMVRRFHLHKRKATYSHRIITAGRKIFTLFWLFPATREWGFWVDGKWVFEKRYRSM